MTSRVLRLIAVNLLAVALACAMNTRYERATCQPLKRGRSADTMVYDTTQVTNRPVIFGGPPPRYPDAPRNAGIQGRVVVSVIIGQDGRAEKNSILVLEHLDPSIDRAAIDYVTHTIFQPGCLVGLPVRTRVQIPIEYKVRSL